MLIKGSCDWSQNMKLFKEEALLGKFQTSIVGIALGGMSKYFPVTFGDIWAYWRNNHGWWLYQEERMDAIAEAVLRKFSDRQSLKGWGASFDFLRGEIERKSSSIRRSEVQKMPAGQLRASYNDLLASQRELWAVSFFLDCFDSGTDQPEIEKIAGKYGFMSEETFILLLPKVSSYVAAWEHALAEHKQGTRSAESLKDEFFWIRSDYFDFEELDDVYIRSVQVPERAGENQLVASKKRDVLRRYALDHNPLEMFQLFAQWRDMRKRLNFKSQYGFMRILTELARRYGMPRELVRQMMPREAEGLFSNELSDELLAQLARRGSEEFFVRYADDSSCDFKQGEEAHAAFTEIEQYLPKSDASEVRGMVASKGYAKGVARVVENMLAANAHAFQEGDILITSMTRPEFLPLMKKAAAIVTNEGGISSHAAIVARELNKPCIIGTRYATQVLKDGDVVEVDAENGVVRKL